MVHFDTILMTVWQLELLRKLWNQGI